MGTVSGLSDTVSLPESGSSTIGLITLDGKGAGKPYESGLGVRLEKLRLGSFKNHRQNVQKCAKSFA